MTLKTEITTLSAEAQAEYKALVTPILGVAVKTESTVETFVKTHLPWVIALGAGFGMGLCVHFLA